MSLTLRSGSQACVNLAAAHASSGRWLEAEFYYKHALSTVPASTAAKARLLADLSHAQLSAGSWEGLTNRLSSLVEALQKGDQGRPPFPYQVRVVCTLY